MHHSRLVPLAAGVTALVLTLGDGLFPPGTGGLGLIVARMTGFAVLFGILAWVYTRPWFQRLSGWAFGAGVVGACIAMTLLDMAVFPPVIRGIMPGAEVIFERYPVPVTVNRFTFCLIWSTLFFVLRQRADFRRARRQAEAARLEATSALLALRTSELERLSQQIEPHFPAVRLLPQASRASGTAGQGEAKRPPARPRPRRGSARRATPGSRWQPKA